MKISPEQPRRWWEVVNKAANEPAEVLIYDAIGKETDWWTGEETCVGAEDFINELKAIGDDRELIVGINSPGGNVWDGIAIYNFLDRRKGKVTTRIDGVAASIASVIAVAGDVVEMPTTAQMMIHDPATIAVGGEADMDRAKNALRSSKKTILAAYTKKTKRSEAELSEKMTAETWFTGDEAKAFGFVDTLTSQQPIFNSFDFSGFKRVPEALREVVNKTAVQTVGKTNNTMDRAKIIALLKKHGGSVEDKATDEQLEAQLDALITAKATAPKAPENKSNAELEAVKAELQAIRDERNNERKSRITREVEDLVTQGRITTNEKDKAIVRAVADESYLTELKERPPIHFAPEAGPIVDVKSDDVRDVLKHIRAGSIVNAAERSALLRKNHDKIVAGWHDSSLKLNEPFKIKNEGTNTIDTTLKQDVILDQVLKAFSYKLTPLSLFSTRYEANPLRGTDKLQVPYIALQSAASTAWNAANGYVAGDTASDNKEITIDQRYYQAMRWTAEEMARQPYLLLEEHATVNGEKLAYDTWINIMGVVTAANYATAAYTGAASAFDSDDGIDLETAATNAKWPETGRLLFLNTAFDNALKKDNAVKLALNVGGAEVLRSGKLPNLFGFTYGRDANVPTNSENLAGFIGFKSAIAIANAPIAPTQEELQAGLVYQTMTDPVTGLSLMSKRFGQPQMNRAFWIVEVAYGFAPLESAALQRIVSA